MTLVMQNTYSYSSKGVIKFLTNRLLRLYPTYWITCLLSIVLIIWLGQENTTTISGSLALPETPSLIFTNITMVSFSLFPNEVAPRLSPATWALTTELFYYGLIAFGISKTKLRTGCWIFLSCVYVILTVVMGYNWHARYFALPAGSLPFSIGAFLFFLHKENWQPTWLNHLMKCKILVTLLIINAVVASLVQAADRLGLIELFMYINLIICSLLIYGIIRGEMIVSISEKMDKILGNFSYPIYLIHWQIGALVSFIVYGQVQILEHQFTPMVWILTGILITVFSLVLIKLVDEPIAIIRNRIKGKKAENTTTMHNPCLSKTARLTLENN